MFSLTFWVWFLASTFKNQMKTYRFFFQKLSEISLEYVLIDYKTQCLRAILSFYKYCILTCIYPYAVRKRTKHTIFVW